MFLTLGSGRASEKDKSRSEKRGTYESELISLLGTDPVLLNHPTSGISYALASPHIRGRGHSGADAPGFSLPRMLRPATVSSSCKNASAYYVLLCGTALL
jgi:hypothetical protein